MLPHSAIAADVTVAGAADIAFALPQRRSELVSMRDAYGLVVGFLFPARLFVVAARPTGASPEVQPVLAAAVAFLLTAAASGLWTALVSRVGQLVLGVGSSRPEAAFWTPRSWL